MIGKNGGLFTFLFVFAFNLVVSWSGSEPDNIL